ncbi:hypothetical protein [Nannocystis pusilla]
MLLKACPESHAWKVRSSDTGGCHATGDLHRLDRHLAATFGP